jgi:predicted ester cyclase
MASEAFNFEKFMQALESKDVEAFLSFFAEDVEFYSEDSDQPIQGKRLLRQLAEQALPVMSQLRIEPRMVLQKGDQFAALLHLTASYSGDLDISGVHLPLAGKSAKINGALFATLNEEGKIVWMHRIRDTASAMKQLGMRPEELDRLQQQVQQFAQTYQ